MSEHGTPTESSDGAAPADQGLPAVDASAEESPAVNASAVNASAGDSSDDDDDDFEDLEFLLDDIEDQIAPLGL